MAFTYNLLPVVIGLCFIEGGTSTWPRSPHHGILPSTSPVPLHPPVFDLDIPTNVTVVASKPALLSCVVHNLNNNSVSWIRHRDLHILSVGSVTYTNDDRFVAVPEKETGNWALRLRFARPGDSGQYDCQISSTPPTARTVHLTVIEPSAYVLHGPEMHVGVGSLVNMTCTVSYSPEAPEYLHWYHKDRMVREDRRRITVKTHLGRYSTSRLIVRDAQPADSGVYTCNPAHSREHSITLHVLTGEYPAAMQGSSSVTLASRKKLVDVFFSPIFNLLVFCHIPHFYM